MRAASLHVQRVQRLACRHEQAVPLHTAEAQVGTDLRQEDYTDSVSVWCENMHAVESLTAPSGTRPDIPVDVRAYAVGAAGLAVVVHARKPAAVAYRFPVDDIPAQDRQGRFGASIRDVKLLVVR